MPPGRAALELLRQVRVSDPWIGFIMLTGHGTIEDAVKAIREGAFDFLTKPVDLDRLRLLIEPARASATRCAARWLACARSSPPSAKRERRQPIARDAQADRSGGAGRPVGRSVLITGESGSGKDFVAQTLHGRSAIRSASTSRSPPVSSAR